MKVFLENNIVDISERNRHIQWMVSVFAVWLVMSDTILLQLRRYYMDGKQYVAPIFVDAIEKFRAQYASMHPVVGEV